MNGRDARDYQGFVSKISHSGSSDEDEGEKLLLWEREEDKKQRGRKLREEES